MTSQTQNASNSTPLTGEDATKQAACLECRKSKVKCVRPTGASSCKKCSNSGSECVVPDYHVGRYKGVKNKRSGLEKAIYQVEEAVKKARTQGPGLQHEQTRALEKLIEDTRGFPGQDWPSKEADSLSNGVDELAPVTYSSQVEDDEGGDAIVNHADNPLQLLAIASAIPEHQDAETVTSATGKLSPDGVSSNAVDDDETVLFFSPIVSKLDIGEDLDPIDLGLVSESKAGELFEYFHNNLSHTRWGPDETLHTANRVRTRSSFLFTSILASAALFIPNSSALSVRLKNHNKFLFQKTISRGYRSLEIVLALMVSIPWMQPGRIWSTDDETCLYLSTALTLALDLSLNKIVTPSTTIRPHGVMAKIAQADCIPARKALNIDGHTSIEPDSILGRRYLRTRERTWLALFSLDRGVCLARGRPWTVPGGALIDTCDSWHISDIANKHDGGLVASSVLRRDFGSLFSSLRDMCNNNQSWVGEGANVVRSVREKVEGFFTRWNNTWAFQIRGEDGRVPPYLEILVAHGKLSAYCSVINQTAAAIGIKHFFRAAGFTAALDVLQVTVQNEARLRSMPNNSVIMVAFAACFVLGLSTTRRGDKTYLAPHVKQSIHRAADVLERIGSYPPHRRGASAMFGKHLKRIMQQHTAAMSNIDDVVAQTSDYVNNNQFNSAKAPYTLLPGNEQTQNTFPGFDSMTDDQLLDFIQNSNNDFNDSDPFPNGEGLFMDWLDWPNIV